MCTFLVAKEPRSQRLRTFYLVGWRLVGFPFEDHPSQPADNFSHLACHAPGTYSSRYTCPAASPFTPWSMTSPCHAMHHRNLAVWGVIDIFFLLLCHTSIPVAAPYSLPGTALMYCNRYGSRKSNQKKNRTPKVKKYPKLKGTELIIFFPIKFH